MNACYDCVLLACLSLVVRVAHDQAATLFARLLETDNGVLVRMALFALVLDVAHLVDQYSQDVRWYNSRQD